MLHQVRVLGPENEMYYETNLKLLSELNKENDKVDCLSFGIGIFAEKVCV